MADDTAVRGGGGGGGLVLTPDPTILTREALVREITALREILEANIVGQAGVVSARFEGMDRAIALLQVISDRLPAQMDAKVATLKALHDEQFKGIQLQFAERDVRVIESATAATTAVNAALQAAKEAVGAQNASFTLGIDKSEKATLEQINQQRVLLEKTGESLDEKINDLKDRMTRAESMGLGRSGAATDQRQVWGVLIGAIGLLVALGSLALVAAR